MKKESSPDPPTDKSIRLDHENVDISGDPQATLTQWRAEALKETEKVSDAKPTKRGKWPDIGSRMAAGRLKDLGINLPWGYGDEFGDQDFKVIGLRAGGLGVVYFVESSRFGGKKLYAAKTLISFLKPDYLDLSTLVQEKISQSFLEEALPWLEMGQHPHIVPIHLLKNVVHPEFKRNIPFVYSEYMPRGSLEGYLREKGQLTLEESLALGIQLCDGLLHAYEHGLEAHLDLKPDNIMVYDDGLFKVTDFSTGVIGTPGYMAPEQVVAMWRIKGVELISDEIPVDRRADQFAVGLVMLEAYLGRCPFPICLSSCLDKDQAKRFANEGVGELADFTLPVTLREILNRVFSRRTNDRYPNLSDLREDLVGIYEDEFGRYEDPDVEVDDTAEWWFDRGQAFYNLGYSALAETPFKEALERYRFITGTEHNQANCTMYLANVYGQTGRFNDAENAYESSIEIYRRTPGTDLEQARCTMNMAIGYEKTGRFDNAERAYESSLETFRSIPGTEREQATCIENLAGVYEQTGRFIEAERFLELSLETFRRIPGTEIGQAKCTENLAGVYQRTGRFIEAERSLELSLETFRSIPGTEFEQATCTENLAMVYEKTSRFDEAERSLELSLETFRRIPGTELQQASCTENLAIVYEKTGRFDEAERAYKSSLKIYHSNLGTELDQARCTGNLAIVYQQTGRFNEAERAYETSLKTYRRIPGTELHQARCTANLAICSYNSKNPTQAHKVASEALKLCEPFPSEATAEIRNVCQQILKELDIH
jgi:tetratricopeptide (TPR) repeat protein